jgi:hypothetical protein
MGERRRFRFGVIGEDIRTGEQLASHARRAEALGFSTLLDGSLVPSGREPPSMAARSLASSWRRRGSRLERSSSTSSSAALGGALAPGVAVGRAVVMAPSLRPGLIDSTMNWP